MKKSKSIIENSIAVITKNAENCSDLARIERAGADELHLTAHKHEKMGHALEAGAARLKDELKAIPE
jgi:hypothetical protein